MKKKIYTIEYGYVQDDLELYCTNEVSFLTKKDYNEYLSNLLISSINNKSHIGYYIECYLDEEEVDKEGIECLKEFKTLEMGASKINEIQQFIIDNSGKKIDYICKEKELFL